MKKKRRPIPAFKNEAQERASGRVTTPAAMSIGARLNVFVWLISNRLRRQFPSGCRSLYLNRSRSRPINEMFPTSR